MILIGKPYKVPIDAVSISTLRTIIEVTAPADRILAICDASITQLNSETSTQEALEWVRKSAAGTGTSVTPRPLQPNSGASGFTARVNCTAEGTVSQSMWTEGFNIVSGYRMQEIPAGWLWVAPSGIAGLRFQQAPEAAIDVSGWLLVQEIG